MLAESEAMTNPIPATCGSHPAIEEQGVRTLTYAQLAAAACSLQQRLAAVHVSAGQTVGLLLPKSAAYVAGLLGVWEAGAAFVPLDPDWPDDRLAWIAQDARLAAIILPDDAPTPAWITRQQTVRVSVTQPVWQSPHAAPTDVPVGVPFAVPVECDALAYLVYTSGSTGRPKGVAVTHRGIVPMLRDQIAAFGVTSASRSLFYLSTAFDAALSDIGTILLAGGTLCIEPPWRLHPGPDFLRLLADRRITHLDFPPSLLGSLDVERLPACLQTVIVGGEAADPATVRRWAQKVRLVNVYGPTEATVCTSLCRCDQDWDRAWIGEPIAGMQYELVDEGLTTVPPGQEGELVIAGPGLAREYWGQPELTRERFVHRHGQRWYRTRDRVVQHADGRLEFLGRLDRQFKLRGRLIEPAEIEARLAAHPALARAACLPREVAGRRVLVAFCEPRPHAAADPRLLRRFLSGALPRWMLPQRFVLLDQLPQTASGKVDLQTLVAWPLPECSITQTAKAGLPGQLRQLWHQTLLCDEIAQEDDFFELGGDSLAALELAALAQTQGLHFSPALVYARPTLGQMAAALIESGVSRDPGDALATSAAAIAAETPSAEAMSADALRADAQALAAAEQPLLEAARNRPRSTSTPATTALVTGATGFLGVHVLAELLQRTELEVVCLVRAADDGHARRRIEQALGAAALRPTPAELQRLTAITGDVSAPRLGLAESAWQAWAERVDSIYHLAAEVHLMKPYAALRLANVLGVREAVRFQASGRTKALHYASTLSVLVATDRNQGVLLEADDLRSVAKVYGGYAQSKFAAELLLRACGAVAGPMAHYRCGLLTGHSQTGSSPPRDLLALFVRGMVALGCVPAGADDVQFDMTPVDYAARAMVQLSLVGASQPERTFHLANPHSVRLAELVSSLQAAGVTLASVTPSEFCQRVAQTLAGDDGAPQAAACLALCRALDPLAYASHRAFDLFQATGVTFGLTATHAALAAAGCPPEELAPPRIARELLQRQIARLLEPIPWASEADRRSLVPLPPRGPTCGG